MLVALAAAAALSSVAQASSPAQIAAIPDCKNQLSLGLDGENGNFDGMSQGGVLLVIRNLGSAACKTPGLPALQFQDAAGHPLALARRAPPGMHPGPVVLPVGIAAGAEATAPLHWVSGDVYDGHHCLQPAKLVAKTGAQTSTIAWRLRLCGPPGKPIPYDQPPLKTDPVLSSATPG